MDRTDFYDAAHQMMVDRKWKVHRGLIGGLGVPSREEVEADGERLLGIINSQEGGMVEMGCFKAYWNNDTKQAEIEVTEREYIG